MSLDESGAPQRRRRAAGAHKGSPAIQPQTPAAAATPITPRSTAATFFAEPDHLAVLSDKVLPRLIEQKGAQETLRVWVCGCGTGEEAYSIAMLLYEHIVRSRPGLRLRVYATDVDRQAVGAARSGSYDAGIAAQVGSERLARHFAHDATLGRYRIQNHVRDLLVFSVHDAMRDPPFSRVDLLVCRHLLTALGPGAQRELIPLFHYALVPGGALFLGSDEGVGGMARMFHAVDRKAPLYLRLPTEVAEQPPALPHPVFGTAAGPYTEAAALAAEPAVEAGSWRQIAEAAWLTQLQRTQAAVLVNSRGRIHHASPGTDRFFGAPATRDADLLALAPEDMKGALTAALHETVAHKQPVSRQGVVVAHDGESLAIDIKVCPTRDDSMSAFYLVLMNEAQALPHGAAQADTVSLAMEDGRNAAARSAQRESELHSNEAYLRTTLAELETSLLELRSSNEEMHVVHEELQTANEELQSSKEELQAVNEELSAVNDELQDKVAELCRTQDQLHALLDEVAVGALFVDAQLRIVGFTPAVMKAMNLIPPDIGRPLLHLASHLRERADHERLIAAIRQVIETATRQELQAPLQNGRWVRISVKPYQDAHRSGLGAVIAFIDLDPLGVR